MSRRVLVMLLVVVLLLGFGQSQLVQAGDIGAEKYEVFLPDVSNHAVKIRSLLGGVVWMDVNGNGRQDAGEPGLGGIPIEVTSYPIDQGPNPISGSLTFLTEDTGEFSVTIFPNYVYVIEAYADPAQWQATTPTRIEFRSPVAPVSFNIGLKARAGK